MAQTLPAVSERRRRAGRKRSGFKLVIAGPEDKGQDAAHSGERRLRALVREPVRLERDHAPIALPMIGERQALFRARQASCALCLDMI
jgi:hypothetical protein